MKKSMNKEIETDMIEATVKRGTYKDQHIRLKIGETAAESRLTINGEPITNCTAANIFIIAGKPTKLFLELTKT